MKVLVSCARSDKSCTPLCRPDTDRRGDQRAQRAPDAQAGVPRAVPGPAAHEGPQVGRPGHRVAPAVRGPPLDLPLLLPHRSKGGMQRECCGPRIPASCCRVSGGTCAHWWLLQVGGGDAALPQPAVAPGHGARRAHAHGLLQGPRQLRALLQGAGGAAIGARLSMPSCMSSDPAYPQLHCCLRVRASLRCLRQARAPCTDAPQALAGCRR